MSVLAVASRPVTRLTTPQAIGVLGIVLGLIACWLALPPIHARGLGWPAVFGILALAAAITSITRGGGRAGWGAAATAILGMSLGIAAQQSGLGNLDLVFAWSVILGATLRYATPLAFAAMGGLVSERSGVVNIGLEGMMLMGAFLGFLGAPSVTTPGRSESLVAMVAGAALAAVHAFFCINLRADQIVVGTGINFLALGITGYAFVDIYGEQGSPTDVPTVGSPSLDFLGHIPDVSIGPVEFGGTFLQAVFGDLNWMIWLSFVVLILTYFVLFRTSLGLRVRAVGEHPRAADTVGISVYGIRWRAVVTSGALAALGGAYLSVGGREPVRPEPDGRAWVHRPRRDHLRQLAALRCVRRMPAVRLLERARRPPARVLRPGQRHASALQRAPVRPHARRRRGRHRTLDASGRRSAVRTSSSSVGGARSGAAWASLLTGLASVVDASARRLPDALQRQYDLLHAGFAIPIVVGARDRRARARRGGHACARR